MKTLLLSLLTLLIVPISALQAQPLTDEVRETVLAEIESLHNQEQKAFIEGDCGKVISFYDKNATIYTRGGQMPSLEVFRSFCKQIPRPFDDQGKMDDKFIVLSEKSAYFLRTIDIKSDKEKTSAIKREIITKIWGKTPEGWKILHFHSSVHTVSPR